ncbi:glycosyltransferase family 4 protein [Priestia endophytica]|uniref:glycosyltransferase family 4 protein n=1 Tax=Priestia endophytica TaxID=135735 RepID=UPI00124E5A94|nr:glycosyltransferase family 4 protein [Priestia endophytica]KAB2494539.1 glycosyltransferase family 4 protein [Priestia endophytica]
MNILILTSIYPQADDEENIGVTPVVQYFANEWAKENHNVIVIHNSSRYPKILYKLPNYLLKKINSRFGIVIPNEKQTDKLCTNVDGVICLRLPMLKVIPKLRYSDNQVKQQFNLINDFLEEKNFKPDIVLGHWETPQIPLLGMFKDKYSTRTALVFHSLVYITQKRYKEWAKKYIKKIDVIGARSENIANQVGELLDLEFSPFLCRSGISDEYFDKEKFPLCDFKDKEKDSYLYVGRLIRRKNVDASILALKEAYNNIHFSFNIIGNGAEKENLIELAKEKDLTSKVHFKGYIHRDKVMDIMNSTQVFIMISDNETFGLVYIEAMSRGCIVIASKNGGMEGIIEDGVNGFLCEQGNAEELALICKRIREMSFEDKGKISNNAINTAYEFRDSAMAKKYLGEVLN